MNIFERSKFRFFWVFFWLRQTLNMTALSHHKAVIWQRRYHMKVSWYSSNSTYFFLSPIYSLFFLNIFFFLLKKLYAKWNTVSNYNHIMHSKQINMIKPISLLEKCLKLNHLSWPYFFHNFPVIISKTFVVKWKTPKL